ncbi:MAG TPA: VOC family protein [Thermoanaerobaculia bacterium]|nr:VOC family protein [Thermoanaerobaculia bacterium]
MREIVRHEPGTFCWPELATTDADSAKALYGGLFGWTFDDQAAASGTTYTVARLAGRDVAALYALERSQRLSGAVVRWNSYAAVASADESATRVKALGGTVFGAPFDVGKNGRMAIVKDPQGATLCLWEARAHPGAQIVGEVGSLCWTELATTDTSAAGHFYASLFGWALKRQETGVRAYTELWKGPRPAGGIMKIEKEREAAGPVWDVYFRVANCDAAVAKARELGAHVSIGPDDIEKVGRYAFLSDREGATFAVMALAP